MSHRASDGYTSTQTANGVDGYDLTIRAQNATGSPSKGGNLILAPGTGTTEDGYIRIDGDLVKFDGYVDTPTISQSDMPTDGVDGYNLTIKSQSSTVDPARGGAIIIQSGDGYSDDGYNRDGYIKLKTGENFIATLDGYNIAFFTEIGSYGTGQGVIYIANATTAPTVDPTGAGVLYVEGGALKYRSPGGVVTTIAPA